MTHGHEKSGPAVVAMKPANKAGAPAAEPVERRAGAEGNANQQRTHRAPTPGSEPGSRDPGAGAREPATGLDPVDMPRGTRGRNGSPRSSTTSTPRRCEWRSSRSGAKPLLAWMG